jgi:hypothetical protein
MILDAETSTNERSDAASRDFLSCAEVGPGGNSKFKIQISELNTLGFLRD